MASVEAEKAPAWPCLGPDPALLEEPSAQNRNVLRQALDLAELRSQYVDGVPHPERIDPAGFRGSLSLDEL
jgi:hypothetical protein